MLRGIVEKQNEVKKVNMRRKVINVSYRKDSKTFSDWMKYEVEVMNEDGTTEMIPAYGKDLQDALRRIVHDEKAELIGSKTKRVPLAIWIALWFTYISLLWSYCSSLPAATAGITFSIGMVAITFTIGYISNWLRKRNRDK
jgi:hypothetical protein